MLRSPIAIAHSILNSVILATEEQRVMAIEQFMADYKSGLTASKHIVKAAMESKELLAPSLNSYSDGENSVEQAISYLTVKLDGFMMASDTMSHYGCGYLANKIMSAKADGASFVIIESNSGGGEALAGHLLNDAVLSCGIPVYAIVHQAGSAAYRAIQNANNIYMSNGAASAGSIGAYYSLNKALIADYAKRFDDIYAQQSTEKNAPLRTYIASADTTLIQAQATKLAEAFIDEVKQARASANDLVFKGAMYFADDAIAYGLADGYSSTTKIVAQFIQSKNDNTMFITDAAKSGYAALIAGLNNLFGSAHTTETEPQVVADSLASMQPISEQLGTMQVSFDAQISGLTAQLEILNERATAAEANATALTTSVTGLQANLRDAQSALATALGNAKSGGVNTPESNAPLSSVDKFTAAMDDISFEGDSKY